MSLEEIIKSQSVPRRNFLKLAAASVLAGCGESEYKNPFKPPKEEAEPDIPIAPVPVNSNEEGNYVRAFTPTYTSQIRISSNNRVDFSNIFGERSIIPGLVDELGNKFSIEENIIVGLYESYENIIISGIDLENRYAPGINILSRFAAKSTVKFNEVLLYAKKALTHGRDVAIKKLEGDLPTWNEGDVINIPGITYRGDWSFNNIKSMNSLINETSTVLSLIPGPQQAPLVSISIVTEEAQKVIDYIDETIDLINENTPLKLDKDYKFSWYDIPGIPFPILVPSGLVDNYRRRNPNFSILDFSPLNIGNRWEYASETENLTNTSLETKNIKGKIVAVIKNSKNVSSYYGYAEGKFKGFGGSDINIGEFYFEPGVLIGDNEIHIGKEFTTKSNIVYADIPDITATVNEIIKYEGKEHVSVPAGEFGDCLRAREETEYDVYNRSTRKRTKGKTIAYHWLARNVGNVKLQIVDGSELLQEATYELQRAEINGIRMPKPVPLDIRWGIDSIARRLYWEVV